MRWDGYEREKKKGGAGGGGGCPCGGHGIHNWFFVVFHEIYGHWATICFRLGLGLLASFADTEPPLLGNENSSPVRRMESPRMCSFVLLVIMSGHNSSTRAMTADGIVMFY
ncbi:hypothetical protein O6H91_Y428500 [Diphasiastrum complanatum]|nr:hypothetical protein O6H91_Y428500 [Diphasiastrum complanatum]